MLLINSIGNCIEFDFTNVPDEYNINDFVKSCPQKQYLRVLLLKDISSGVRLIVNNDERFYLPFEMVTSVNGVVPTSNLHLYDLLKTAIST